MDLLVKALGVALGAHRGQLRKGSGAPYFVHLLDTCKYLMFETDDVEVLCAGVLHDVLEDTSYSKDELESEFGGRVLSLVLFCSEPLNFVGASDIDLRDSWKDRKLHSISKLDSASVDECLVFCCDKVSSLLSIKEDLLNNIDIWGFLRGSRSDVLWYYSQIGLKLSGKIGDRRIFKIYQDLLEDISNS